MSIHMAFWKESMINRLSKLINRNRWAAKISQVLCSIRYAIQCNCASNVLFLGPTGLMKLTGSDYNIGHMSRFKIYLIP